MISLGAILRFAGRIGENVAAAACCVGLDALARAFLAKFGPDLRHWPYWCFWLLGLAVFALGGLAYRILFDTQRSRQNRPVTPDQTASEPVAENVYIVALVEGLRAALKALLRSKKD